MLIAAPAPGFAEDMPNPGFGSIAKQAPAPKDAGAMSGRRLRKARSAAESLNVLKTVHPENI